MTNLIIALAEEIGNPNLFIGREQEMVFYLDWAEGTNGFSEKQEQWMQANGMYTNLHEVCT